MIWYFLCGMIAGAFTYDRFVRAMAKKIRKRKQMEAFKKNGMQGDE